MDHKMKGLVSRIISQYKYIDTCCYSQMLNDVDIYDIYGYKPLNCHSE